MTRFRFLYVRASLVFAVIAPAMASPEILNPLVRQRADPQVTLYADGY